MSRTSFKVFCVEFYANHIGKSGPEWTVGALFFGQYLEEQEERKQ